MRAIVFYQGDMARAAVEFSLIAQYIQIHFEKFIIWKSYDINWDIADK